MNKEIKKKSITVEDTANFKIMVKQRNRSRFKYSRPYFSEQNDPDFEIENKTGKTLKVKGFPRKCRLKLICGFSADRGILPSPHLSFIYGQPITGAGSKAWCEKDI